MFFTSRPKKAEINEENPYWISYSDLMSGLLIIFILLCMGLLYRVYNFRYNIEAQLEKKDKDYAEIKKQFIQELKDKSAKMDILEKNYKANIMREIEDTFNKNSLIRQQILSEIKSELTTQGIEVYIDDNKTVLRIPETTLNFDTNESEIMEKYKNKARKIGEVLHKVLKEGDRWQNLETIFIEGHTDSKKAKDNPRFNWDLSTQRAVSLWQFWLHETDYGEKLNQFSNKDENGKPKPLFSVSGYADTRRVVINEENEYDFKKNRRIDIRFTTRQPVLEELENWDSSFKR